MAPIHHHFEKKRLGRVYNCNKILDNCDYIIINWTSNLKAKVKYASNSYLKELSFLVYGLGASGRSVVKFFSKKLK